jgi:hypothetical protein
MNKLTYMFRLTPYYVFDSLGFLQTFLFLRISLSFSLFLSLPILPKTSLLEDKGNEKFEILHSEGRYL